MHYAGSTGGKMEFWNCAKYCGSIRDNADAAKALYVAREQANPRQEMLANVLEAYDPP